ncbi:MAG: DUF3883 domain-containing protein [Clostridia bacterium]|nr:DUF3883 domain-containing protein [Clostridia bacterium]
MKTYISDSLISEALILLQAMKQNNCFTAIQIESIKTYYGINKKTALNLALQCRWVEAVNDAEYALTSFGEKLMRDFNDMQLYKGLYRDILFNYIRVCKPIWSRKIPYGRNEAYRIMSDDEQICFKKAGLMCNPVTREEVDWWDSLAKLERAEIDQQKDDIGRKGEELTIGYEKKRTNTTPIWESIDSNLAGFDIISQVSSKDATQILIEVKSSNKQMQDASFFVTHNEWQFASAGCNKNRYYFYLWLLNSTPKLAIVPTSEIEKHIPLESGQGEWSETIIPFSAFHNYFESIDK